MTKVDYTYERRMILNYNEGKEDGLKEVAINLLSDNMSVESVSKNTGLDLATVEELNKSIQDQKQTVTV